MRPILLLLLPALAAAQTSPCDLNNDKVVDVLDVQAAVAMWTGKLPCTAKIAGEGICNETVIQRIRDAAFGGACVTSRSVVLTWTASTSPNVAGYYIYRGVAAGGPYTKLNSRPVAAVTYTDSTVERGKTYYYVATTVNEAKQESTYSNEATAIIP